jgi:uncharacterized protein (DUF2062 family)/ubiquinone/menaquinone biosynthesis C-methylase UbiE
LLRGAPSAELRRFLHGLRTEADGPGREAAAIGAGVFIGALPFYGFHLLICLVAGSLFRLNRLRLYLAANISNPVMAPFLIFSELQVGALVRRGELRSLTLDAVKRIDPWSFGVDILLGSLIVGAALGLTIGGTTWLLTREGDDDPLFAGLVRRASDRFVSVSILAWEFARGKLRGDPLYRTVLMDGVLPSGGTLVDVGCGTGLMLALLAEADSTFRTGKWPAGAPAPPVFDELVGIELRPRVARLAMSALGESAAILQADARDAALEGADAVLFFDVLHMMPAGDQERLLASMARRLRPEGVMLVREADAGAGWGFRTVRAGNRLKAVAVGRWRQTFHFRSAAEWTALFQRMGFAVTCHAAGEGTPFANVLFVLRREGSASQA